MHENLIKNLIKYKLNLANSIVQSLPPDIGKSFKDLGKLILDGVNEGTAELRANSSPPKESNELNQVPIE